jgi:hypothetical protein
MGFFSYGFFQLWVQLWVFLAMGSARLAVG